MDSQEIEKLRGADVDNLTFLITRFLNQQKYVAALQIRLARAEGSFSNLSRGSRELYRSAMCQLEHFRKEYKDFDDFNKLPDFLKP